MYLKRLASAPLVSRDMRMLNPPIGDSVGLFSLVASSALQLMWRLVNDVSLKLPCESMVQAVPTLFLHFLLPLEL